jgi:hypothetical protein
MANVCACGCGQLLPEESTRQYKRGHKTRTANTDSFTETETEQPDSEFTAEPLSIDDVADITPDDPEPKDQPAFKPKSNVKITAAIRRDVTGKVAFGLALTGQMWSLADPICGMAFLDNADNIATKLTPVICQSPEMVKWLTKTGNFVLYVDLFMACWPVIQIIFAHHIAKSITADASQNGQVQRTPNDYVVQ